MREWFIFESLAQFGFFGLVWMSIRLILDVRRSKTTKKRLGALVGLIGVLIGGVFFAIYIWPSPYEYWESSEYIFRTDRCGKDVNGKYSLLCSELHRLVPVGRLEDDTVRTGFGDTDVYIMPGQMYGAAATHVKPGWHATNFSEQELSAGFDNLAPVFNN